MKKNPVEVGSRVEFRSRRGMVRGIVTNLKSSHRRKMEKLARRLGIHDHFGYHIAVAEIKPDDGDGYFGRVPLDELKVIGKARGNKALGARMAVDDIKTSIKVRRNEIHSRRVGEMRENHLFGLRHGDKVMVEYRGGVMQERTFVRFSANRVRVRNDWGREQWIYPKFVKPVKTKLKFA